LAVVFCKTNEAAPKLQFLKQPQIFEKTAKTLTESPKGIIIPNEYRAAPGTPFGFPTEIFTGSLIVGKVP
jgi:hypothetical protein